MSSSHVKSIIRQTLAALVVLGVFPHPLFGQEALCRASLSTYVEDRNLKGRWEGNTVILQRAGVEYVCSCTSGSRPPVCSPRSAAPARAGGVDFSQFNPAQQMALMGAQALLNGLFRSLLSSDSKPSTAPTVSAEETLRLQQQRLQEQEAQRVAALEDWKLFQDEEKKRLQAERDDALKSGKALLNKMGGGQDLTYQPVSGGELGFAEWTASKPVPKPSESGKYPAPKTAAEQAQCAAYFSNKALELSRLGRSEDVQFANLQAQKAMAGQPTDVPCQMAAAGAGLAKGQDPSPGPPQALSQNPVVDVNALVEQYGAKVKELLEVSQKLADARKVKVEAEYDARKAEARIRDIKDRAASVTRPEEKQQLDDLLEQALALQTESGARLKTAQENENACLTSARLAEEQVKQLNSKLPKSKDDK